MYQCKAGHLAVHKYLDRREKEKKNKNPRMIYFFDIEKCKYCPYREGCHKEGAKRKHIVKPSKATPTVNRHSSRKQNTSKKK